MPNYHPELFLRDLDGNIYTLQITITFHADDRLTGIQILPTGHALSHTKHRTIIFFVADAEPDVEPQPFTMDVPYDGVLESEIAIQIVEHTEKEDRVRFEKVLSIPTDEKTVPSFPQPVPHPERNPRSKEKRPNRRYRYD